MVGHRCKRCIWWDSVHEMVVLIPPMHGKKTMGFCRKHKPGAVQVQSYYYGVQPVMDAEEFCGEFREEGK